MKLNSFIIFVALLMNQFSCSYIGKSPTIYGKYKLEVKREYAGYYCEITLNQDGTYSFFEEGHWFQSKSFGNWYLEKDSILLTSQKKYGIQTVTEVQNIKDDSIKIEAFDNNLYPLEGAYVIINNDKIYQDYSNVIVLNENGIGYFKRQTVKSLAIDRIDLEKHLYFTKDSDATYFKFIVNLKEQNYSYFNSEKWAVKKNKLVITKDYVLYKIH